jgi:hemolysin D
MLRMPPQRPTLSKRQAWEFLPAVLEIEESPPSPVGRTIAWTIIAVFTAAVLWAAVSTVDIVAVAPGRVIPSDYSKVIQPLESGVISAIHVQNGQEVHQGQVLIELDATASSADHARLVNEHQATSVEIARLRALLAGKETLEAPRGTDPTLLAVQQQLLRDQLAEHRARLESARLVVEQRRAALAATQVNIERLKAIVPMLEERASVYYQLWQKTYVAKLQYLGVEQDRIEKVKELAAQEHRRVQDTAALAEAQKQYHAILAEFKRTRLSELAAAETRATSLAREVAKAGNRTSLQRLTAPIDGVVQQLAVHTLGGVVTPAQPLLVIAPKNQPLEVEAWVENKDIGFVRAGQPAEVKVAAFPFTRYGTLAAQVVTLSHDAVPLESGGLAYAARVNLEQTAIQVDSAQVPLSPGMAVTVEIKTGTRHLLEYFFSPLLQAGQESARER